MELNVRARRRYSSWPLFLRAAIWKNISKRDFRLRVKGFDCSFYCLVSIPFQLQNCSSAMPVYYPTILVILQKAWETGTNIPRYCAIGYCTVPRARSSCYTCSFLSSYWKRLKKVKFDNKSLIRCFGVKYRRIFLRVICILTRLAGSSKYSTTPKHI